MSSVKKTLASGARKAGSAGAKASARAARSAAGTAAKNAPDFETSSKWFIRVVTSVPQYLRLYLALLTDERVSHKAKALLITAIGLLGANFAMGGALFHIQSALSILLGPFAFLPTILILLITLDICYSLIASDVMETYEKTLLGEENSLQADINRLREFMGSKYEKVRDRWTKKSEKAQSKMEDKGLIVDGELTDEVLQDVADQIVQLETSDKLQKQMQKEVKRLGGGDKVADKILGETERKMLEG